VPGASVPKLRAAGASRSLHAPRFTSILVATAILFAVSPLLAPGSLGKSALLSMLPFAAVLAIASIGQTLVIQQRGLDLSVPGMITLTTILVTKVPNGDAGKLPEAIGLVVVACVCSGLISGLAITRFGITPLVATLGTGALLQGAILQITNGTATVSTPSALDSFALAKTLGIPNTVWIAVAVVVVVSIVIRSTVVGRRFVAVGASPRAARAAGIRVQRYEVATYIVAALTYGIAGVLIAGYLRTPGIATGNDYLLPTIAAVVLGGTSLAGGSGSVIATAIGALFLTQLEQVVLGMGAPDAVQLVIQGAIIALGMALRTAPWREWSQRLAGRSGAPGPGPTLLDGAEP
jgi:ribose transport system permease protein